MTPPAIAVEAITVRYGARAALDDVSGVFPPGSLIAVLGPNGAGKSTLVRALTRRARLESGAVRYDARRIDEISAQALARLVAVVPQDVWVPFEYTVLEMTLMGRSPWTGALGLESGRDVEIARAALERLGLREMERRPIQTLSGGERQRVLLARALAQDAPILLLDEPTAHLDVAYQRETMELVAELHREGRTVIAVLHDLNLASLYCPRLVLLSNGKVVADGPPEEVLTGPVLTGVYGPAVVVAAHPGTGRPAVLPASPRG